MTYLNKKLLNFYIIDIQFNIIKINKFSKMKKNSIDLDNSSKKQDKKKQKQKYKGEKPPKIPKYSLANLKNQIQHHVNPKKIVQFVRKSSKSIPNFLTKQQTKALLPKLQKIMLSNININDSLKSRSKFQQIENQLTHSMVLFKKNNQIQNSDLWAIDLQTQKCYKMIPQFYFKSHISLQQLTKNLTLTKNHTQMQEGIYQLMDYLDQVEFNINQQAAAKIKIFMEFIICMNSIQDLVMINAQKISATRKHTGILRDIVVSRSIRINQQRIKKQKVKQTLDILMVFKKMKTIENKLNAQISLGNYFTHDPKSKIGSLLIEYCQIHNIQLKKFCCKTRKALCKYWDISYFVQKGFQQNFIKMIRSYLFQLINIQMQIEKLRRALIINKKNFMTTPANAMNLSIQHNNLDQSYEVDAYDHVQLITKIHIQKQILTIFQQGVHHYNFQTDNFCKDIHHYLSSYVNNFLKESLNGVGIDIKQTLKDLNYLQQANYLQTDQCKDKIMKLSWGNYQKMIQMILVRFQYFQIRLLSLVQKILAKLRLIKQQRKIKCGQIDENMKKVVNTCYTQSDELLYSILKLRINQGQKSITLFKSKDDIAKQMDAETQSMRKLLKICSKWLNHIESLSKTYPLCSEELQKKYTKNYLGINLSNRLKPSKILEFKEFLVKSSYQILHKILISRDLRQKVEQDTWQFIEIKSQIYNDIGYIIGGKQFVVEDQSNKRQLISNSLIMQRSISDMQKSQQPSTYNKQQYSSKFKINPNYITLGNLKFKLVSSTQQMITFLKKYLQLYDETESIGKKQDLQAKMTQLIIMYNQYIKDLIIKGEAVKLGRIKTKSVTARQLIIAYIQIQVIDIVYSTQIIQNRIGFTNEDCSIMHSKNIATQTQIRKKYQKIIQMRIMDSIQAINVKDQNISQNQHMLSIPKNFHNSIELFSDLMLIEQEFQKFIDMEPNWAAQLLNKVGKGSKGKQNKIKYFKFLEQQIKQFSKYVPKLVVAIKSVLY